MMEKYTQRLFRIERTVILLLFFKVHILHSQTPKIISAILPSQYSVHFAGSIGFISLGAGYSNASDNLNMSFHYGYVPEAFGGRLDILTARLVYKPVRLLVGHSMTWTPINPVVFISYTLNDGFYASWPEDQYPKNYYWWSSAYRLHAGINSEWMFPSNPSNKFIKNYAGYIELNTNDLYIASYATNRNFLSLYDIIKIGAGVKINLL